jgi:hypothetical protein
MIEVVTLLFLPVMLLFVLVFIWERVLRAFVRIVDFIWGEFTR